MLESEGDFVGFSSIFHGKTDIFKLEVCAREFGRVPSPPLRKSGRIHVLVFNLVNVTIFLYSIFIRFLETSTIWVYPMIEQRLRETKKIGNYYFISWLYSFCFVFNFCKMSEIIRRERKKSFLIHSEVT